jgi:translocation and assembly module TamA
VDPDYVRSKTGWSAGDTYDPEHIRAFKERLLETGLFSMVQVTHPENLNEQGRLPVTVEFKERKRHSISAGLGYDTDVGPNLSASWEDRNLLGKGENLRYELSLSPPLQELRARYRQPVFFRTDQSVVLQGALKNEDTEAYTSTGGEVSLDVERQLSSSNTVSAGIGYSFADLKDAEDSDFYHLLFLPLTFDHDTRQDVLDPRNAIHVRFDLIPYQEIAQVSNQFLKNIVSGWWYPGLTETGVLALRARVGSIHGAPTEDVPADVRFYAGGGGSIRGYPFQEIGPRRDSDPFGGRSLVECSAELRFRLTERFGSAIFVDGGDVYDEPVPEFDSSFRWGAGVGLRYFTAVGPLRLDVAFPLNRDPDHHDDFQVYISLGQAF